MTGHHASKDARLVLTSDLAQLRLAVEGVPLQDPEVQGLLTPGHPEALGGRVTPALTPKH